jgi:DNA-directed RNA polymerase sigma subunit (sigma70/sigma32)
MVETNEYDLQALNEFQRKFLAMRFQALNERQRKVLILRYGFANASTRRWRRLVTNLA